MGGERVRFRRASAKPERRPVPKAGQRAGVREKGSDREREIDGEIEN